MAASDSASNIEGRVKEPAVYILAGLYLCLLCGCIHQFIKSLGYPNSQSLNRQRAFYIVIAFTSSMRIIWALYFLYSSSNSTTTDILDILPSLSLGLLGSTFSILWFEMFLCSTIIIKQTSKMKYFVFATGFYIAFNIFCIVMQMIIIYYPKKSWIVLDSPSSSSLVVDCFQNFTVSLTLIITGHLLANNVKIIFYGKVGIIIARRIKLTCLCSFFVFFSKSIISVLMLTYISFNPGNSVFDTVIFFLYFCCLEIIPFTIILYILRFMDCHNDDDCLPSALNSFICSEFQNSEAAMNLGVRLFNGFDTASEVSLIRMCTKSLSALDNEGEKVAKYNTRIREYTT
ncbi:hypothetical protein SteCoe_12472 [Stentor coeruleus]|uniref:THH1/TOM1/TOM3 domain-containing protein n=1 Tax=Stentor coeruleus TaxID=5963 RepID=A0A1R2CAS4_9CILI|nr:hypothetical protein SteCoe_12472 [Stentor coeruleus]